MNREEAYGFLLPLRGAYVPAGGTAAAQFARLSCDDATHYSATRANCTASCDAQGIPEGALPSGLELAEALEAVGTLARRAQVAVAHNAAFDRAFIGDVGLPWVCSMEELAWPRSVSGRSLAAIALAHDVGIVSTHRALADCLILARLFERASELGHDVRAMLRRGLRPKKTYQAMVSYADRELAKAAGFSWDGDTKRWTRRLAAADVAGLPFKVVPVAA